MGSEISFWLLHSTSMALHMNRLPACSQAHLKVIIQTTKGKQNAFNCKIMLSFAYSFLHLHADNSVIEIIEAGTRFPICLPLCRIFSDIVCSVCLCLIKHVFANNLIDWACSLHPTDRQKESILFPENVKL